MTQLLCKIVGHREFDSEIIAARPWEARDLHAYSEIDFREPHCLRCGHEIAA